MSLVPFNPCRGKPVVRMEGVETVIAQVKDYVRKYMSSKDPSHDYEHVERVLQLALSIQAQEEHNHPELQYNTDAIILSSLLHDVGKKALTPHDDDDDTVEKLLLSLGVSAVLAETVQQIIRHVYYSFELKYPKVVYTYMYMFPELAVIQDADRLDFIGATGIARLVASHTVKNQELGTGIKHVGEKVKKLESMMKTGVGKRMFEVRKQRVLEFQGWWEKEMAGE